MREARIGDTVRVHFTGKSTDGTVCESSHGSDPIEFKLGNSEVMKGLEDMVRGMRSGERREGKIPPHLAHGKHRDDLLLAVERERFPRHIDPYTGLHLQMTREGKGPAVVVVVATTGDMVLLDTNHPLAGKALMVEVELVYIVGVHSEVAC